MTRYIWWKWHTNEKTGEVCRSRKGGLARWTRHPSLWAALRSHWPTQSAVVFGVAIDLEHLVLCKCLATMDCQSSFDFCVRGWSLPSWSRWKWWGKKIIAKEEALRHWSILEIPRCTFLWSLHTGTNICKELDRHRWQLYWQFCEIAMKRKRSGWRCWTAERCWKATWTRKQ